MRGSVTRRGKSSWRLKFEAGERDAVTGKRRTQFLTVRGTKKEAQAELVRLLAAIDNGTAVEPSKITVAEYIRGWLDSDTELSRRRVSDIDNWRNSRLFLTSARRFCRSFVPPR
jgi:hypothetical protein